MEFYTSCIQIGNNLYYRGYANGKPIQYKKPLTPVLYTKTLENTELKSLEGFNVKPITFANVYDANNFIKQYKDISDFAVYGYEKFHYVELVKMYPDIVQYNIQYIRIFYIDIETTTEFGFPDIDNPQEEVLCLTIKDSYTNKTITWGSRQLTKEVDFEYIYCKNEKELLLKLIDYWQLCMPDIVSGYNSYLFDIPYLFARIKVVLGEHEILSFSPWRKIKKTTVTKFNKEHVAYDIVGISQLDYLDLYKKFTYVTQENYKLDTICEIELGIGKVDHSQHETFKDYYTNDFDGFIFYNKVDTDLVGKLEDKLKLIELAIAVSFDAKINFGDVYAQTCAWDNIIYNYLHNKGIVVPAKHVYEKDEKFDGAYVKEPIPGMYWDVVSFDLASLYPHIIQLLNISPETKVDKRSTATINGILDKTFDSSEYTGFSISPSATLYDNSISGMMPDLMKKYYSERKVYKKKQQQAEADYIHTPSQELQNKISTYKNIQMAKKIAMNSAYGVMGCRFFRYYDLDNANAITSMGQVAIRWVSNHLNDYLNTVLKTDGVDRIITNDTDSLFMNLNDLVIKRYGTERPDYTTVTNFLDLFSEKYIAPFIRDCYDDLGKYLNVKNQCLSMVRDVITINFLIKGKKRYIAQVTDCEGLRYPEPKLKFVGIEVVRSSTPRFFRDKLKESCKIIMTGDNTQLLNYISDIRNEMTTVPTNLISFGTGVSDAVKYADSNIKCGYIKGTPIGCRAAIIYNKYVVDNKLESKYPLITSGDKIKYVYLTMPNIFKENVLGYIGEIPNSSKVVKYLDYDLMLEKAFVNPLSELLDIVGWKIKEIATLESFFT